MLDELKRRREVRAERGGDGGSSRKHGANGTHAVIAVPCGTLVWRDGGELLVDLVEPGSYVVVAKGGEGGRGNGGMATSTRQAPRIAERGLLGQRVRIRLELRLLAQVGLVGLPNVGKSSLLRAMSAAQPKVGAYPFTTLEPYLGVVEVGYDSFVMADIPGLIEGAHEGAGLGVEFLQHVRRTGLLVHVLDGTAAEPVKDLEVVRSELASFGHGLVEKPWIVVVNKIDVSEVRDRLAELRRVLARIGAEVYATSALTGEGTPELAMGILERLKAEQPAWPVAAPAVLRPKAVTLRVAVVARDGAYEVQGEAAERVVRKLGTKTEEACAEALRRLRRLGLATALRRAGAQPGARLRIAGEELEWPG